MRPPLRSYITFSRNEKYGVLALTILLMLLLLVRTAMHFFIKPDFNDARQTRLQQAWKQFEQTHADTAITPQEFADRTDDGVIPLPATININTADSATLVRLRGIGPVTAHKIMEYRGHQQFANFDELRKLCRMSAANTALLQPHITFK